MGAGRPAVATGEPISEGQFAGLLQAFERTSFRLEAQPVYAIGEEGPDFERFLAGSPQSPSEIGWWAEWLHDAAAQAAQGKRLSRIRVIPDNGPTAYQRWLIWADPWYAQAGVDIRYIRHLRAEWIGLPMQDDWQLLDGDRLVIMRFTDAGEIAGKELITDPATVEQYRQWQDLATRNAIPAAQLSAA
jgi:hypothetical protein